MPSMRMSIIRPEAPVDVPSAFPQIVPHNKTAQLANGRQREGTAWVLGSADASSLRQV